jgi:hypothetical protein
MIFTSRVLCSISLLLAVIGCSNSKTPSGVSGKVTYKGEPVSAGTITFHRTGENQGGAYPFNLKSDGTYEGSGMPAEEMIVTIDTESANPDKPKQTYSQSGQGGSPSNEYEKMMREKVPEAAAAAKTDGKYVKIPPQYADKAKSPLKVTLSKGKNPLNFDLKDQ